MVSVLAVVSLLPGGMGRPEPAAAASGSSIAVSGHGWGHGRGLGQWGSLGYAVDDGWSYTQILDHYYGGTSMGSMSDADEIDVALKNAIVDTKLFLTSSREFYVTYEIGRTKYSVVVPGGSYVAIARNNSNGQWGIYQSTSCGSWGNPVATADDTMGPEGWFGWRSADSVDQLVNVVRCDTSGGVADSRAYRGKVRAEWDGSATVARNRVLVGEYLRGAVPRESPAYWADLGGGKGLNALKAQAVAARSYARAYTRNGGAICDTTSCQVYGGAGHNGALIEDSRTNRAVAETDGQVRLRDGAVMSTEYSSSTGGWTAGGAFPAVRDDGDDVSGNTNHNWSTTLAASSIEAAYPAIGSFTGVSVSERNGLGADGGRVKNVTITGSQGSTTVKGTSFQWAFGLKSDWFSFTEAPTVVDVAATGTGGFWTVTSSGAVTPHGGVATYGALDGVALNRPVVGIAATPSGRGYWMVASDGGIFAFGDARFYGSTGSLRLNAPIVGMASTSTGNGYWLVASDGGIFSYGDARFYGSMGGVALFRPVVGMASTPSGNGYWLVASDGGIFAFGDASFHGSTGGTVLNAPIVGMARTPTGTGYWFVAADGGVFSFGAPFAGSTGGQTVASVTGMAATPSGAGYWLVTTNGTVYSFGS